jgi:hypothetical protein
LVGKCHCDIRANQKKPVLPAIEGLFASVDAENAEFDDDGLTAVDEYPTPSGGHRRGDEAGLFTGEACRRVWLQGS